MADYSLAKKLSLLSQGYMVSILKFNCRTNITSVVDPAFPKSKPSLKQMKSKD